MKTVFINRMKMEIAEEYDMDSVRFGLQQLLRNHNYNTRPNQPWNKRKKKKPANR